MSLEVTQTPWFLSFLLSTVVVCLKADLLTCKVGVNKVCSTKTQTGACTRIREGIVEHTLFITDILVINEDVFSLSFPMWATIYINVVVLLQTYVLTEHVPQYGSRCSQFTEKIKFMNTILRVSHFLWQCLT